jgi:GNAT superfamily N-acetyltransferase
LVPASTLTPAATTSRPPPPADTVRVSIPPAALADDQQAVLALTAIVNAVYHETESDLFVAGYQRTNEAEIAAFLRAGQLAVASLGDAPLPPADKILGCVCVKRLSPRLGEFGMLALSPAHRGGGLGSRMARFAEDHCRAMGCAAMQLEILIPQTFEHAFKARLLKWYVRMGYQLVKLGNFLEDYPHIAVLLAGPTEYRVFEKALDS